MDILHPDVSIDGVHDQMHTVKGAHTSITAFVSCSLQGPFNQAVSIHSQKEYERVFGSLSLQSPMGFAVRDFFANGGTHAIIVRVENEESGGSPNISKSLHALDHTSSFNLLCIPPLSFDTDIDPAVWGDAANYCEQRQAILLVDPPSIWQSATQAKADLASAGVPVSANAALYFPRLLQINPLNANQVDSFVPCGAVAGVIARTDARRGVWKSPAGLEARILGIQGLSLTLTDAENATLGESGINCLRFDNASGSVIWGARTLQGHHQAHEWRYLPVRRMALFLEQSLTKALQWTAVRPNDEALWQSIEHSAENFLQHLHRQGAFQGRAATDAFFVRCDRSTTTQADVSNGKIILQIGFAPLKPHEFVTLRLILRGRKGIVCSRAVSSAQTPGISD